MTARRLIVEADGGSRGNPGPAGYGAVVRDADSGEVLAERADGLGRATNNVAEYSGLIAGLTAAVDLDPGEVEVRMDSKLVIEQMSGRWKIRSPELRALAAEAAALVRRLPSVRFSWIPRERNRYADRLANEAMDAAAAGRAWRPSAPGGQSEPARAPATGWSAPSEPPTRTILLRHGATELSGERRFSGRGDPPLTDRGRSQAMAAGRRLAEGERPVAIVSSPLKRARTTADLVAAELGVPVTTDDGLIEADFGQWEGFTFAEVRDRWPDELAAWLESPDVAPPGGQNLNSLARDVRRARDRVLAGYPGRTVLLVSHVTPIKLLLRAALGAPVPVVYRLHLDVASLCEIDWYADSPASVRLVNDTGHLRPNLRC